MSYIVRMEYIGKKEKRSPSGHGKWRESAAPIQEWGPIPPALPVQAA